MPTNGSTKGFPQLLTLAAIIVVVAALYFAQEVLVPIVLAFLLCFMLAPLVRRVERTGLGRIPAVILVVLFSFSILGSVGWIMTRQVIDVTGKLPEYKHNIRHKVESLRGQAASPVTQLTKTIQEISRLATQPTTQTAPAPGADASLQDLIVPQAAPPIMPTLDPNPPSRPTEPIPVQIVDSSSNLWTTITSTLGMIMGPLATFGIVVILVVFFLIQREDLRDRIISLMGRNRIHVTTVAFDDAAHRISRYLLMQLIVNCSYGIPVAIGLYLMDIPNAMLWGMLGIILRYLPYIGPWLSAAMPIALSLAVFDDWWHPLMVIGFFVVLELIENNAVEPWLYGHSTGLSSTAVIIAAIFWTWLWGPMGLLISTPITACLVVLGRHIPQLEFLSTLLGDQPVLDPPTRFYQRLLAMDQEEAVDLLEDFLETGTTPLELYDRLLLPALRLAEKDHHRGNLDEERLRFVYQSIRTIIDEIGEKLQQEVKESPEEAPPDQAPASLPRDFVVLSLPSHDEADELAAAMLSQLLMSRGFNATHLSAEHLSGEMMKELTASCAKVVCISALPPNAIVHARYLFKKLRAQTPETPILVGLWSLRADPQKIAARVGAEGLAKVVTTFAQAVQEIHLLAQNATLPPQGIKTRPQKAGASA